MKQDQASKTQLIERAREDLGGQPPSEAAEKAKKNIRRAAKLLAEVIVDNTEGSRQQSTALTLLEQTTAIAEKAADLIED